MQNGNDRKEATAEKPGSKYKMSTVRLHLVKTGLDRSEGTLENRAGRIVAGSIAVLLFALLCFTTATVWVEQNWSLQFFQIGIYALVIVQILLGIRNSGEAVVWQIRPLLVYAIPLWGIFQLLGHTTVSTFLTRGEVLRWGALVGVFYLTRTVMRSQLSGQRFLIAFVCFATAMATLCLMQINTSHGKILWFIDTRYADIYATFQNKNNFSQFVELALPVALWQAVRHGWRSWWYALAAGILYASAIGAASRAGFALCTAELIAVPAIGLTRMRKMSGRSPLNSTAGVILIICAAAAAFTTAVGWKPALHRFDDNDPYAIRREYVRGAIDMAEHRPLIGYGLGTFRYAYQRYTIMDSVQDTVHAHNDWAEFAAEGGIPFLLLIAIPFFGAIPSAVRHPWALGLVATILNAFVDFPFPRPAVSGWMFALLAILYTTSWREEPNGAERRNREPRHGN